MINFDLPAIPAKKIKKIKKSIKEHDLRPEVVCAKSFAAGCICEWVREIVLIHDGMTAPKLEENKGDQVATKQQSPAKNSPAKVPKI